MLGSIIGAAASLFGGSQADKAAKRQEALQREFAQNAIQWKAADAEKAGISKVFAMGAPTVSYSPVSTGDSGISAAGAALGKGIDGQLGNLSTTSGKITGIQQQMATAQLTGLNLDNDIKRAELLSKQAIASQPGAGGVLDHATTTGPDGIKIKKEMAPSGFGTGNKSFGVSPEVDMWRTKFGYAPEVPQELGEAQESQPLSAAQWFIRNKILPSFSTAARTFPYPAPAGSYWRFNPVFGEYQLHKLKGKQLERFYPYP